MSFFKKKQKKLIVTIHGFGKNVSHEFDPFKKFLDPKKYEVIQFDMYDPQDPNDNDYKKWIQKAENKLNEFKGREIILLGFSMGGVIASYLASIYKIKTLILVAPAFQYLDLSKVTNHGVQIVKNLANPKKSETIPSSSQTKAFQTIVSKYKETISMVDCPVYIFHGTKDEVIPLDSSRQAYKKISGKKRLIFIEGGKHRMMYDGRLEKCIFDLIEAALEGKMM